MSIVTIIFYGEGDSLFVNVDHHVFLAPLNTQEMSLGKVQGQGQVKVKVRVNGKVEVKVKSKVKVKVNIKVKVKVRVRSGSRPGSIKKIILSIYYQLHFW